MRILLTLSFFLVSSGYEASSQVAKEHLNVPLWFERCIALSETHIAFEMDNRCLWNAYDYCEIGRVHEERRPCFESLNAHIHKETEALAAKLPQKPAGLSKLKERSYVRRLEQFRNDQTEPDCTQMTEFMCETFGFVSRWSFVRELARTSGILEGTKPQ